MPASHWKMRHRALDTKMLHFRDRVAHVVPSHDHLKDTLPDVTGERPAGHSNEQESKRGPWLRPGGCHGSR